MVRSDRGWSRVPTSGAPTAVPLLLLRCRWPACDRRFLMCSACYRGHTYCSLQCSIAGRTESLARARAKYVPPVEVRERRRLRQREAYAEKKLTAISPDQTSKVPQDAERLVPSHVPAPDPSCVEATHVPQPASSISPPDEAPLRARRPVGPPRCTACRQPGTYVVAGARRFRR